MDKKMFRSLLLLVTYAIVLVAVIVKLDTITGWLGGVLDSFQPIFIGAAIAFVGNLIYQLLRHGITATTLLWIAPYVIAALLIGWAAKASGFQMSRTKTVAVMLIAELLITALNTGALFIDSKIYGYYGAYLFALTIPRLALALAKGIVFGAILPPLTGAIKKALPQTT